MTVVQARQIAPRAQRFFERASNIQVLHIFERVCNLANETGEVVSLVSSTLRPDPLAIVLDTAVDFTGHVKSDDEGLYKDGWLQLGKMRVDIREAVVWEAKPDWEVAQRRQREVQAMLYELTEMLGLHAPVDSMVSVILEHPSSGRSVYSDEQNWFLEAAHTPARALCMAVREQDRGASKEAAKALMGLGGGLTPAGDDFIVGALHALWVINTGGARSFAREMVEEASGRTTRLSTSWLQAAADGEAGARWHDLITALAESKIEDAADALMDIVRIGHSSGADALGGFWGVIAD